MDSRGVSRPSVTRRGPGLSFFARARARPKSREGPVRARSESVDHPEHRSAARAGRVTVTVRALGNLVRTAPPPPNDDGMTFTSARVACTDGVFPIAAAHDRYRGRVVLFLSRDDTPSMRPLSCEVRDRFTHGHVKFERKPEFGSGRERPKSRDRRRGANGPPSGDPFPTRVLAGT